MTKKLIIYILLLAFLLNSCENEETINNPQTNLLVKLFGGTSDERSPILIKINDGSGYYFISNSKSTDLDVSGNIILENFDTNIWLVKLNNNFEIIWKKNYGGSKFEMPTDLIEVNDGLIFTAVTSSTDGDLLGINDFGSKSWIVKLNLTGEIIWQNVEVNQDFPKIINNTTEEINICFGNKVINFNIVNGLLNSSHNLSTISKLHKYNDNYIRTYKENNETKIELVDNNFQNALWLKTFSDTRGYYNAVKLSNNNIALIGYIGSHTVPNYHAYSDVLVTILNSSGEVILDKAFGGTLSESGYSVSEINNELIISAVTTSGNGDVPNNYLSDVGDFWIFRINQTGHIIWSKNFGGTNSENFGNSFLFNDVFFVCGSTYSNNYDFNNLNNGEEDICIFKIDTTQ